MSKDITTGYKSWESDGEGYHEHNSEKMKIYDEATKAYIRPMLHEGAKILEALPNEVTLLMPQARLTFDLSKIKVKE